MRNIERRMLEAIEQGASFRLDNTRVTQLDGGECEVHLFNNHIATITPKAIRFTLAGWDTVTTRSRVNAILHRLLGGPPYASVFRQRGETVFARDHTENGRIISDTEWTEVKR